MKKLKNYINGKTKENLKLNQSGRVWECATPATLIVQLAIQQNFRELSSEITEYTIVFVLNSLFTRRDWLKNFVMLFVKL